MSDTSRTKLPLTERERQVLRLAAEGKSSREIADTLFVSKRTVDFHRANLFAKIRVRRIVAAINWGRENGVLP